MSCLSTKLTNGCVFKKMIIRIIYLNINNIITSCLKSLNLTLLANGLVEWADTKFGNSQSAASFKRSVQSDLTERYLKAAGLRVVYLQQSVFHGVRSSLVGE